MRFALLIIFVCCFIWPAAAQPDTTRLRLLMQSVQNAYDHHPDSFDYYADKLIPLAQKLNDISIETKTQRMHGAKVFLNGDFNKAVEIYLAMIRKAEKYPPFGELGTLYFELSGVYSKNGYFDIARHYNMLGMEVANKLNDDHVRADGYNRLGIMAEREKKLDSALYYYNLSLACYEKVSISLGKSYSLENIAGIYEQTGQHQKALDFEKQALEYRLQNGTDKFGIAISLMNVGEMYEDLGVHDSAIYYTQKTIELARSIDYKDITKYAYQFLSRVYEHLNDYKTALNYQHKYDELNQSIFNDKSKQIADLNARYQTEKKEQQIKTLNQQTAIQQLQLRQRNYLLFISLGLLMMAIVVAYFVYNRRKIIEQAKVQAAVAEQQEITAKEVLHAEERERRRIASDLHDGVGQLLSAALMNMNGLFKKINIDTNKEPLADKTLALVNESYDELRQISHQMIPNALVKTGLASAVKELVMHIDQTKLAINLETVGLNKRLDEEIETVLYRVIQESINNVIKHAAATKLQIQLVKDTDGIAVTIEDNGKGFEVNKVNPEGIGLRNMISRIQFHKGTIDIDSHPGKGTLIAIYIPA